MMPGRSESAVAAAVANRSSCRFPAWRQANPACTPPPLIPPQQRNDTCEPPGNYSQGRHAFWLPTLFCADN